MKTNKEVVLNSIVNYEVNFKGGLLEGYNNKEEFKKDTLELLSSNEDINMMIVCYKSTLANSDNTNSTEEQRKALSNLILELEGFQFIVEGGLI